MTREDKEALSYVEPDIAQHGPWAQGNITTLGRMVSPNIRIYLEPQNMTLIENRVPADVIR